MRGYCGIGVQSISKAHNLGAVLRTAHAFGAHFAFTLNSSLKYAHIRQADTSNSVQHMPFYEWQNEDELCLPKHCQLIGIEMCNQAIHLPRFRHPLNCAYVLGPEKGALSEKLQARCQHIVKIPTKFCINVSLAAALALYDRILYLERYPPREKSSI